MSQIMNKFVFLVFGCILFLSCDYNGKENRNFKKEDLKSRSLNSPQTTIELNIASLDLKDFSWNENQKGVFRLKNTGNKLLVIDEITTSCGCTKVNYHKQPIIPGSSTEITVIYKAEHPGHFNKTIAVYCNAKESPLQLRITGNAR